MPLYSYRCTQCDSATDHYSSIAERHNGPECCDGRMTLQIVPVAVVGEMKPYYCVATEQMVTSRKQRRDVIKQHGLIEAG